MSTTPYLQGLIRTLESYPGTDITVRAQNRSTLEFLLSFRHEKDLLMDLSGTLTGANARPLNTHEWRVFQMISETCEIHLRDHCDSIRSKHNRLMAQRG